MPTNNPPTPPSLESACAPGLSAEERTQRFWDQCDNSSDIHFKNRNELAAVILAAESDARRKALEGITHFAGYSLGEIHRIRTFFRYLRVPEKQFDSNEGLKQMLIRFDFNYRPGNESEGHATAREEGA